MRYIILGLLLVGCSQYPGLEGQVMTDENGCKYLVVSSEFKTVNLEKIHNSCEVSK